MMRLGLLVELLAIVALAAEVPVTVAATVALIAATPTSAYTIYRILRTDNSVTGVVDVVFLFLTWTSLPCLLLLQATDGVGENVFRFVVAIRLFAVVSIWRFLRRWRRSSANSVIDEVNPEISSEMESAPTGILDANEYQ